jgi:acyl-CoA thioesterase FadM
VLAESTYRVPMADVDAASIIYYATPYRWREQLYTAWLAAIGHPLVELLASGDGCPCVASSAEYVRPVRLDDVLSFQLVPDQVGRTSFSDRFEARAADGEISVIVRATQVWIEAGADGTFTPAPLPDWLRTAVGG